MTRITVRLRSAVARLRHEANKRAIYAHTHTLVKTRRHDGQTKKKKKKLGECKRWLYSFMYYGAQAQTNVSATLSLSHLTNISM